MDQDGTWHGGRLIPGDFVLDRGPASSPKIFRPFLMWTNGWMHQDATWYGSRPPPRRLCVRWGPSPSPKKGAEPPSQFSAHFYCGQMAGCIKLPPVMEIGLGPGDFVLDGDPVPLPKKVVDPLLIFSPCLLQPNGCMDQDATWYGGKSWPIRHYVRW